MVEVSNMPEEILTLEEMKTRYPSEWILVENPETDEHLEIRRGKVLFHSKDRDELDRKDRELHPQSAAYIYTGEIPENSAVIL